jgi:ankyrin repeat protein
MLVAAGAKVKPEDIDYSVTFGPDKMVRWFLDRGVNPAQIQDGKTLLFDAGSPKIVDLLVARGVNVHARDETGRTALHAAIQRTSPAKIVTALLKHGADPNARIKGGFTPLMLAEDGPTVDALVAGGANLHATNDQGEGVLYAGWGSGIPSRIEALARHGLRLDPAKTGELLVNAIVLQRNLGAVKKLLALGADPNSATMWEGQPASTPLSAAIGNGEYEMAKVLRAAGANDVGELSEAASKGDISTMSALIDKGANINELSGGYGDTPLCYAVRQGRAEAVHFLLSRGANVNIFSNTGYTALSMAFLLQASVAHGNYSPIRRLGVAEAKPLMEEIIAAILQSKPDPNFRDRNGETALMVGAARGNVISVEEGTDVNLQRPDGMTALMIAVATQPKNASKDGPGSVGIDRKDGKGTHRMSSRAHVVSTLIGKGADLSFRNNAGKTALDLARENGNEEILALLADASR